ncbi:MAG: tetratricopeptide repeat protein [bacterium]|nr:tetratricopeptide repeat protein [bacterium]
MLPHYALGYVSVAIIASILISTFLSSNTYKSFIGQGFEIGTASFLLLMFLVSFFASRIAIKNKEAIFNIYAAVFVSFIVLALFHIFRIIGGADFMTLGILGNLTSTVVGKWYDFAILSGIAGLLSFFGIKFLFLGKGFKWILSISLLIAGGLLFIVNSSLIWTAISLIVLCVIAYEYSIGTASGTGIQRILSRISFLTFAVFIIASVLAWKGDAIAVPVIKALKVEQGEAILPWQLTIDVAASTLKESPLFGAGPNRFSYQFLRFKPLEINPTAFWNSEFSRGFGVLPTFLVTLGLVGAILWCAFFIFFIRDGARALKKPSDPFRKFFISSTFFTALFLWLMNLIYIPSHVTIFFTFLFTGLFVASLVEAGVATEKEYGLSGGRMRKYAPTILSLAIVILIVWLGVYAKKATAIYFFQQGIKELNTNKTADQAKERFLKALSWDISDIYYQALSEVNIIKINSLVQEIQKKTSEASSRGSAQQEPDPKIVEQITALVKEAVDYTNSAIEADPTNYYNYISQARISEIAASLSVPNAYEGAKNSYANAISLNPYNPGIYLSLANLEASQKKNEEAQQYIGRALQLKQNYIEAIFLLAQIQVNNGQIKDAITSVKVATQINPNDPTLLFQLGILYYNDKNYIEATASLLKAVELNSQYANARYFLGLSQARLGKNADAIVQFEELAKTNPDNEEITFILSNLKDGKSPFTDAQPPIDNMPEKRKALPVPETSGPPESTPSKAAN